MKVVNFFIFWDRDSNGFRLSMHLGGILIPNPPAPTFQVLSLYVCTTELDCHLYT